MPNLFQVSSLIAQTTTEFFLQKSPLYNSSNHDYESEFKQQSYKTGGTINIKVPGNPPVQTGLSVSASNIQDLVIPYTITESDIYSVVRNLNSYEEIFDIGGGSKALTTAQKKAVVDNYGYPAFQSLEGRIEQECVTRLKSTAYITPVDTIEKLESQSVNSFDAISECDELANEMKVDISRYMMMNSRDARLVSNSLQNYFAQTYALKVLKSAFIGNGDKGNLAGFDVWRSTELKKHTAGTLGQSNSTRNIVVDSVSSDGKTITFSGVPSTTATLIKAGDRISIPSVNLVSNITHTDIRFKLVVTAAADAQGNNDGTIDVVISFPLLASGEHQNVTALPAGSAPAVVYPDRYLNFFYTKAGLSTVPLMLPEIYGATNNKSDANPFPIRVILQGAALEMQNNYRLASLVGIQAFAPYAFELPSKV